MGSWQPLSLCETGILRGRRSLATLTMATGKLLNTFTALQPGTQTERRVVTASCCCHSEVGMGGN